MRAVFLLALSSSMLAEASVSLLRQGSVISNKVSVLSHETYAPLNHLADFAKMSPPVNPRPHGHMLTDTELKPIDNIACLQAKQVDPTVDCSSMAWSQQGPVAMNPLNAGNYPMWKDSRCNSNGEHFCDPDSLLSTSERANVTALLKRLRQEHQVTCGPQLQHDKVDKWHYEEFYLGVAIAKDFPLHESDSQSLQSFGRILAGRWNMTFPYDGNPAFYARCPHEAMLIILPDKNQAHLSSSSCMFICEDHGGPEVALATALSLESNGLFDAVKAGISKAYEVIATTSPQHPNGWEATEQTAGTWESWNKAQATHLATAPSNLEDGIWNWVQRILFGFAVILLAGSLIGAMLVCYVAPGLAKDLTLNRSRSQYGTVV